jgi:hypothetical protein
MNTTLNIAIVLAFVVIAIMGLAALKARRQGEAGEPTSGGVKAKRLLTSNELEFLARLEAACPELRFHAQVAMGAVLEPSVPRSNRQAFMRARGRFAQKIIDFVAQDRNSGEVVAIIELDDRTHNAEKDAKRDDLLQSAGYRTVRWDSKDKPDAVAIRALLWEPPALG